MKTHITCICIIALQILQTSCNKIELSESNPEIARYTGDSYGELKSPFIHYPDSNATDHETTWTCVEFGSYPQAEVLAAPTTAVDDYALDTDNTIIDATLYATLQQATWQNNETTIDGTKYRRMTSTDAVRADTDSRGHYRWGSLSEYHYFKYQPVCWRILNITGNTAILLADKALDCQRFNDTQQEVNWSTCSLRQWLNSNVYNTMFTDTERQSIILSEVQNPINYYFGTSCGPDTQDNIYILDEHEVFCDQQAVSYGFLNTDGIDDPARRFRPTMYAKCRGVWISPVESYKGNTFWLMRSTGYTALNVPYVCEFGYLYNRGTLVNCDDSGIIPVIQVNLATSNLQSVGTISSNEVIQ